MIPDEEARLLQQVNQALREKNDLLQQTISAKEKTIGLLEEQITLQDQLIDELQQEATLLTQQVQELQDHLKQGSYNGHLSPSSAVRFSRQRRAYERKAIRDEVDPLEK